MSTLKRKVGNTEVTRRLRQSSDQAWLENEIAWLQASEIACAVADAWVLNDLARVGPTLRETLNRLEKVTRPSAMRKVRS